MRNPLGHKRGIVEVVEAVDSRHERCRIGHQPRERAACCGSVLPLDLTLQDRSLLIRPWGTPGAIDEVAQLLVDHACGQHLGNAGRKSGLSRALGSDEPDASSRARGILALPMRFHPTMMAVVGRYSYVAILVFVMIGCLWLEVALRTRVLRRPLRLVLAIAPALVLFFAWDVYAVAQGHWWFDPDLILGVHLPGDVPVDEVLFFVAIPIASILTLEAVRSVKSHWRVGDEESS